MGSVAPQLIEEVTAHAQSDSLEDTRVICTEGTYFPNNLRIQQAGRKELMKALKQNNVQIQFFMFR